MADHFVRRCVDHWSAIIDESDIGVDWIDAEEHCWRCGTKSKRLQKCHIVAKQFGGPLTPDNVVMLCAFCHDEQPDVTDPAEVWRWIKETKPALPALGCLAGERAIEICRSRGVDLTKFSAEKFKSVCTNSVGLHLMQSGSGCRIKASSYAWAIEQACRQEQPDGR